MPSRAGDGVARHRAPWWADGRGCDVYRYDFDQGREWRVASVSTRSASETLPTIWRDRIAFARVYERRRGARRVVPVLYLGSLSVRGRRHRWTGGTVGELERLERGGPPVAGPTPTALDLRGDRLAYAWSFISSCEGSAGESSDAPAATQIWVESTRRRQYYFARDQYSGPFEIEDSR